MASTFTSDIGSVTRLATSAPFGRYLTEQIIENSAMIQSGLIQTDARLNNITGVLAELPFFDQLAYTEENIDSSATWGTQGKGVLTTQKHTASTQYSPIITRGAAFAADMLSSTRPVKTLWRTSALSCRARSTPTSPARSSAS